MYYLVGLWLQVVESDDSVYKIKNTNMRCTTSVSQFRVTHSVLESGRCYKDWKLATRELLAATLQTNVKGDAVMRPTCWLDDFEWMNVNVFAKQMHPELVLINTETLLHNMLWTHKTFHSHFFKIQDNNVSIFTSIQSVPTSDSQNSEFLFLQRST